MADVGFPQNRGGLFVALLAEAVVTRRSTPESYAMCKADMIGEGQDINAIRRGDTLNDDKHAGTRYDYCLSHPPYGGDWKAS